jgi:hypothetical protein
MEQSCNSSVSLVTPLVQCQSHSLFNQHDVSPIAELSKVQRSKACTCHAYERYLSSDYAHAEARPDINVYICIK